MCCLIKINKKHTVSVSNEDIIWEDVVVAYATGRNFEEQDCKSTKEQIEPRKSNGQLRQSFSLDIFANNYPNVLDLAIMKRSWNSSYSIASFEDSKLTGKVLLPL